MDVSLCCSITATTGGHSLYNDDQGIQVHIKFTPLLPVLAAGEKCRKNATAKTISKVTYLHEDVPFHDGLAKVLVVIKREDLWDGFQVVDGVIKQAQFDITYTIPRSQLKDVNIESFTDWPEMIKQSVKKGSPEIRLQVTQRKVYYL